MLKNTKLNKTTKGIRLKWSDASAKQTKSAAFTLKNCILHPVDTKKSSALKLIENHSDIKLLVP